jgi:hypothetical protein
MNPHLPHVAFRIGVQLVSPVPRRAIHTALRRG